MALWVWSAALKLLEDRLGDAHLMKHSDPNPWETEEASLSDTGRPCPKQNQTETTATTKLN